VSNFSINRILDNSSPETALVSADSSMFGSSAAAAASLPVALHHQHKSLIDAAKMIWLHQQLAAQQNHHRLIQANTGSLARECPLLPQFFYIFRSFESINSANIETLCASKKKTFSYSKV